MTQENNKLPKLSDKILKDGPIYKKIQLIVKEWADIYERMDDLPIANILRTIFELEKSTSLQGGEQPSQ